MNIINKVHLVLVLFAVVALGIFVVQGVNNTARANGSESKTAASGTRNKVKPFSLADASTSINGSLGASTENKASSINNLFPGLTVPGGGAAQAIAQTVASPALEGFAALSPINRSGVRALINVKRVGQTETISGFATNMDPNKTYVSLFYDGGSPGSGPCACISSNPPPAALQSTCATTQAPSINFSQMVIGYWLPLTGNSTRTLQVLKSGAINAPAPLAFVPLEDIGAVSVREDTQAGQVLPAAPDSTRFQLRACGKFKIDTD